MTVALETVEDLTKETAIPSLSCAGRALARVLAMTGNYSYLIDSEETEILSQMKGLSEEALGVMGSLLTRKWPSFHALAFDTEIFHELLFAGLVHSTDVLTGVSVSSALLDPEISSNMRVPEISSQLSLLDVFLDSLDAEDLRGLAKACLGGKSPQSGPKEKTKAAIKEAFNGRQQTLFGSMNDKDKLAKICASWARAKNFVLVKEAVMRLFACLSFCLDSQAEDAWKHRLPQALVLSFARNYTLPQVPTGSSSNGQQHPPQFETRAKVELHRVLGKIGDGCEKFDANYLPAAEAVEALLKEKLSGSGIAEYFALPVWRQQEHTLRKLASVLWHSVAVLERKKDFSQALDRLLLLIENPNLGSESRRAKWLVRALVNCGHLKFNEIAKEVKKKADAMTLTEAGNFEVAKHYQRFVDKRDAVAVLKGIDVKEETVVIPGAKQRDYGWVESAAYQFAYADKWPNFLHCEGSVLLRIFGLCMIDALYSEEPSWVFRSPLQQLPSDLSENEAGMDELVNAVVRISMFTAEDLEIFIKDQLTRVGRCRTIGFNPEFDVHLPEIARCIGPTTLSVCFERLLSNVYHWSGGLPDLMLWDCDSWRAKFVEVKGPGDSLSARQALWLRTLASAGADACVLYVTDRPSETSASSGAKSGKRKKT